MLFRSLAMAEKVAHSQATILLRGPSGTGKELLARYIHQQSLRDSRPMVTINCGAIPETLLESELFGYERGAFTGALERKLGKVELAQGGTLFLDEVAELAPAIQVKLLRFLQEKTFYRVGGVKRQSADVRILAATNRDLEGLLREGRFREDLYYRLNVVSLFLPALKERRDDIPPLARHFLQHYGRGEFSLSKGAEKALMDYDWPGNVRELENVMERASVICEGRSVEAQDLPFGADVLTCFYRKVEHGSKEDELYPFPIPEEGFSLAKLEREVVEKVFLLEEGVKTKTAKRLGLTRRQLDSKLKRYSLD